MPLPDITWSALTAAEVDQMIDLLNSELKRRHLLATAEQTVTEIGHAVLDNEQIGMGDPWRQPVTVGYPRNWEVVHGGKTWVSTVANNVWTPGASGWREKSTGGAPPAFLQPTGGHDAYQIGDRVTFQGAGYESVIANNVWSPTAHPAGWKRL